MCGCSKYCYQTLTHTHLTALCPGLPGWAGTRKVKPIRILLMQETVSGSGISWAICKSAPRSRQITMPAPHHSVFYRLDALLPPNQQCQSTEGTEYMNIHCKWLNEEGNANVPCPPLSTSVWPWLYTDVHDCTGLRHVYWDLIYSGFFLYIYMSTSKCCTVLFNACLFNLFLHCLR